VAGKKSDQRVAEVLDDLAAQLGLRIKQGKGGPYLAGPDGSRVDTWREDFPYDVRMSGKQYGKAKRALQIELLKLQRSIKSAGGRLIIVFEGRDAAGKGGTIKRFTENLNPRGARIVALEKPTEREQTEWYLQRYVAHLPAAGEIVMFDRSWYNRAGVERVMGFCRPEQLRRFIDRQQDPVKQWKLSPIDLASLDKWDAYTEAKEAMFFFTDVPDAPWTVVKSNDKKRARIEAMRYVLSRVPYEDKDDNLVGQPDPLIVGPAPLLYESAERAS
jgi:polyphosphate kinase